ncbi:PDZ domain (Also known as DHR or GLGF) [Posidoniimonas corsicana]|uniref:PDZ domain (Also known as DHR or GLGF) n=1 Tax=Posidoniimonas corsicana TaxID=1938618 RepID=A0A5C5VGC1_9BACT|nr:PDZ domain-containing protein [Posidoniimonas corsicana]TWT36987.1 PDZ domain (Also known as DHR or GLGF) [Posidoniimonas corsicana]
MSRSVLLIVALAATPVLAQGPRITTYGPESLEHLKRSTLSQLLPPSLHAAAGIATPVNRVELNWGLKFDAMPELYQRLPELQDGAGLYVSEVRAGSPAEAAGIRAGHVVLQVNGQIATDPAKVGPLDRPADLILLTGAGPHKVTLQPRVALPTSSRVGGMWQTTGPRSASASSSVGRSPVTAFASSMTNGLYKIEAVVQTADGPQKVNLAGAAGEVQKQLDALSPEVAAALRAQM